MTEVIYHEKPELPGVMFMECPTYGTMSKEFCGDSHIKSNTKEFAEKRRREECRHCPIGILHAGKSHATAPSSRLLGKNLCSRCERMVSRIVGANRVCPSCFNRQREISHGDGLNAKGNKIKKIRRYRDIPLTVISNGNAQVVEAKQVMTMSEAVLASLITSEKQLSFAWAGVMPVPTSD